MKAMSKTKATARVQITVEVTLDNPWGPDATIADINRTARREAVELVQMHFRPEHRVSLFGDAKVIAVIVGEE